MNIPWRAKELGHSDPSESTASVTRGKHTDTAGRAVVWPSRTHQGGQPEGLEMLVGHGNGHWPRSDSPWDYMLDHE